MACAHLELGVRVGFCPVFNNVGTQEINAGTHEVSGSVAGRVSAAAEAFLIVALPRRSAGRQQLPAREPKGMDGPCPLLT